MIGTGMMTIIVNVIVSGTVILTVVVIRIVTSAIIWTIIGLIIDIVTGIRRIAGIGVTDPVTGIVVVGIDHAVGADPLRSDTIGVMSPEATGHRKARRKIIAE
jgi:hypothetical protein